MQVVESEHNLLNYVYRLLLREVLKLAQTLEELASFDDLGDNVVVDVVFHQVNNANDFGMAFAAKNTELILQQLNVDFPLPDRSFLHYFDCKLIAGVDVNTPPHLPEGTRTESFANFVFGLN